MLKNSTFLDPDQSELPNIYSGNAVVDTMLFKQPPTPKQNDIRTFYFILQKGAHVCLFLYMYTPKKVHSRSPPLCYCFGIQFYATIGP